MLRDRVTSTLPISLSLVLAAALAAVAALSA
jgi:hypothetical protein